MVLSRARNALLAYALMAIAALSFASAQPRAELNRFAPSEQARDGFALSGPETLGHMNLSAQLYLDYANDPLVYESRQGSASSASFGIVEHQVTAHLNAALGITEHLSVYLGLPLVILQNGEGASALPVGVIDADDATASASGLPLHLAGGFGVGDISLGARVKIFQTEDERFTLGAQARLIVPLGRLANGDHHYVGERGIAGHPELLLGLRFGRLRLLANIGATFRGDTPDCQDPDPDLRGPGVRCFTGTSVRDELNYGLGGIFELLDDRSLHLIAELYGRTNFDGFFDREETPLELLVGAKYHHSSGLVAGVGGGPGLVRGFGSPLIRVFATVGYSTPAQVAEPVDTDGDGLMDPDDACPQEPEDADGFQDEDGCPDLDNDEDGILDPEDTCPLEPEDVDTYQDEDGCPDVDNDADGILDAHDQCPLEAEDVDTYRDEDGCPDLDNDGDTVLDTDDSCPLEAGDPSNRGCPVLDRDEDGVPDHEDTCIDEPGTVEFHGCPEVTRVIIHDERIEILDTVYFRTNSDVIQRRSYSLLDAVASVLNGHPEITRVRVEGHTDSRGRMAHNMDLSRRRAQSVMNYLVEHGVDASRLESEGYGPTRPVVENARTRADHARNRRVVFQILEHGGASVAERSTE